MSIRVLVADDEALVRDGLRAIAELEGDIEIVGDAADGQEAVHLARTLRPDVVLMDIRMPGSDGIAATRAVMAAPDPPKILVLTTFDSDDYVYQAMRARAASCSRTYAVANSRPPSAR
jgi:DNA-binding NarL/FixJ family response regulator